MDGIGGYADTDIQPVKKKKRVRIKKRRAACLAENPNTFKQPALKLPGISMGKTGTPKSPKIPIITKTPAIKGSKPKRVRISKVRAGSFKEPKASEIAIEKEHKALYKKVKAEFASKGEKFSMSLDDFAKAIAQEHIDEKTDYYELLKKHVEPVKFDEEFEKKHPRDDDGKFGSKDEGDNKKLSTKEELHRDVRKIRREMYFSKEMPDIKEIKNKYAELKNVEDKVQSNIAALEEIKEIGRLHWLKDRKIWRDSGEPDFDVVKETEKIFKNTKFTKSELQDICKSLTIPYDKNKDNTKRLMLKISGDVRRYAFGGKLEVFDGKADNKQVTFDEEFESKHPRADDGKFGTKSATQAADAGSEYREVKAKGWDSKALDEIFTTITDNYNEWKSSGLHQLKRINY